MIKKYRVLIVLIIALIPAVISIFLIQDDMIAIPLSSTGLILVLIASFFIRKKNSA